MRAVEAAAIAGGVSSAALMEKAGEAVAQVVQKGWTKRPVVVVCGPGNNGGDGFVAARRLKVAGWPVTALMLGEKTNLKGDAKLMAELYDGETAAFSADRLDGAGVIIDAIFGTGLSRAVDGAALAAINAINASPAHAVSVDLPSGVNADTGAIMGGVVQASRTVTFFAKKPGHVLFPGRAVCGAVEVGDIGIEPAHLGEIKVDVFENQPPLWARAFGRPTWQTHKYDRGHVFVVSGGPHNTGAARLAARGAQRIGAGLVTVLSSEAAAAANAAHLTSIMIEIAEDAGAIAQTLAEKAQYARVAVVGPAAGVGEATKGKTIAALRSSSAAVLDADALTSFEEDVSPLFEALRADDVITPHHGEFVRLFGAFGDSGRLAAARAAAAKAGCVCVLKGSDTIIASPDGRAAINVNGPPDLATAGSGDVLAGFIAGVRAQGAPGFEAAAAGVWFHSAAALGVGPGLVADDLPNAVPGVLRALMSPPQSEGGPEHQAS
jgi:NAD(P)H-hydrate epimerase